MNATIIIDTGGFCYIKHPSRPGHYTTLKVHVSSDPKVLLRKKISQFLGEIVVEERKKYKNTRHVLEMKNVLKYVIEHVKQGVAKIKYGGATAFCEYEINSYDLIV